MRHMVRKNKLSRNTAARKALIKSQTISLIKNGQLRTTLPKARVLKAFTDRLISYAIKGDVASRRHVLTFIPDRDVVHKLFSEIALKFQKQEQKGGYTRVLKIGRRKGDSAYIALVTIGAPEVKVVKKKKEEKK